MSEEEILDILENQISDYVIGDYCERCDDNKICADRNEDCYYIQAIDGIIDLYNKKKEAVESLKSTLEVVIKQRDDNQKEIEKLKATPNYRFTITYVDKDKTDGSYNGSKQYTVSLIAETLEQAREKLDKIAPNNNNYTYKYIIQWSAEELLKE